MQPNDHDLLIRLDTKLENLTIEVKGLRDNTLARIASIEAVKLDKSVFDLHKEESERTAKLQNAAIAEISTSQKEQMKYVYIGMGILLTVQFVIMAMNK